MENCSLNYLCFGRSYQIKPNAYTTISSNQNWGTMSLPEQLSNATKYNLGEVVQGTGADAGKYFAEII